MRGPGAQVQRGSAARGPGRQGAPAEPGPGRVRGAPGSPAAPRQEAFSARGRARRWLSRPAAARWAWPAPRALGMAVAAAPPPEGRLPGTAGGRRGIRAEALEPPLAFPLPPEPRWRTGGGLWRRGLRPKGQSRSRGSQGYGDFPTVPPGIPIPQRPEPARPAQGPGRLATRAAARYPAWGSPSALCQPSTRAPGPSAHRVKQEQVCSQMPLTTPLPRSPVGLLLLRPPAQNQTVPNKSAIVAFPTPVAAPPPGAEPGPHFTCPGPAGGRGSGASERGLPLPLAPSFPSPSAPSTDPWPSGGGRGWEGSFLT